MVVHGLPDEPEASTTRGAERRRQPTSETQDGGDALHRVEEQVHAWIASRLRGTPAIYLPTMDEGLDSDDALFQTKRKTKFKLGKLHTADTTIIN